MTDPLTAFIVLALGIAMVIVVIGGGIWMCVRTADADHPPRTRPAPNDAVSNGEVPNDVAPVTPLVTEDAASGAAVPATEPAPAPLAS
ncbi:MAG: hypothetical protein ACTHJH_13415 [Marmoricola sp.]